MAVINLLSIPSRRLPPGAVYIGARDARMGLPKSVFAIPPRLLAQTTPKALAGYNRWLWSQVRQGRIPWSSLQALAGKDLACACAHDPGHGHVLERAADFAAARLPAALAACLDQAAPPWDDS